MSETAIKGTEDEVPWWQRTRRSPDGFRHPTQYGVERHPTNPHRFLLQFDYGEQLEIDVHQALSLIEMMSGFLRGCIASEHERERAREPARNPHELRP